MDEDLKKILALDFVAGANLENMNGFGIGTLKDGYTVCCDELSISKNEALLNAKREDIQDFLEIKWNISSYLSRASRHNVIFRIEKYNKEFSINMKYDIKFISERVSIETKGLKK